MPRDDRLLLAIDSSTEIAGLALYDGDSVSELIWNAGRHQTVSLIPEVDQLLRLNGRDLADVRAVAVAIGPGSFNGLRVGLSVAKGLAYALGLPLVGVGTLDATAYPHTGARAPIRALVLAGRGRAVFADFRYRNGNWRRLSELRNVAVAELVEGLTEKTVLVGDMSEALANQLAAAPLAVVPPPALRARRPAYLAEIGHRRWQAGEVDVLEALEPVYVHGVAPGAPVTAG
ncbi:MAG TPA: tRNA (adenosine(37)-N6)-threonylcarbamoyltransferase complex dimerization subunit type 1 TsaB [Thermomicrobiaceae bacterium]|nr:tRNA (adenosine(37)-N6)-threonylcarbamoyltransferase complex dimerization subunit type 1 TsaB [Thermomicrobiaceae bacterium]